MARLFTSGWEVASDTNGHEWANIVDIATRSTTVVRSGAASGFVTDLLTSTEQGWANQFSSSLVSGPLYLRVYFRLGTTPSADNTIVAFIAGANPTATSTNDAQIRLSSTGTLKLFANNSQVGSASSALSTGVWYRIELEVDNTPAAGSKVIKGYLDGTQFAGTTTSSDVGGTINGLAVGANLNAETQTAGEWWFDDCAVNDATGSEQNGLPGDGKVIALRPNAAGDSNGFNNTSNAAGSSNNYQLVDENPPNDATDMVQHNTNNTLDLYNFAASGIGASDTVNVVHVHLRRRNNTADAATAVSPVVVKTSGGTQATGVAVVPNSTTWRTGSTTSGSIILPNYTGYTDPDGAAWSQATLDTLQTGPKITTGGTNRVQVSAVWVTVDYTPVTSSDATATPGVVAAAATIPAPSLSVGATVTAAVVAAAASVPAAAVAAGSTVGAAAVAAAASVPSPTVSATGAPIGTLVDDFDDNSIDTARWPANYGGVAETGGQFVIDCDTGQWSGLRSGAAYTLAGSQMSVRAYPAAANTASVAYLSVLVTTTTPGTDAGFNIDTASNGIAFLDRVGFSDGGAVFDTYSPTDHAWLRLREDAGTLYWETSPDGQTWTVRRTGTTPGWASDGDLALVCESHRDVGADNTSAIDNVNVIPATVTPATVAAAASIPGPTVAAGAGIAPASVAAAAGIPAPTVTAGAAANPATVAATATVPTPAAAAGSTAQPAAVVAATTVPASTPSAGAAAQPDTVAATAAVPTATTTAGSTVTAGTVAASTAVPTADVSTGATATPTPVAATTAVPQPTVSAGSTVTPAAVQAAASVPSPAISAGGSATAAPNPVAATANVPTPAVSAGAVGAPAAVAATASIPTATVGGAATAAPNPVAAVTAVSQPDVTTAGTATPSTVQASATVPAPTTSAGTTATPATVAVVTAIPAATVDTATGATATPAPVAALATVPTAAYSAGITVAAQPVMALATVPAVTVSAVVPTVPGVHTAGTTRATATAGAARPGLTPGAARAGLTATTSRG